MGITKPFDSLSHHANLLIGGDAIHDELISILEKKHKIKTHGNPDFYDRTYETFSIDDARELKSSASTRSVADKKFFILRMNGITVEAQNALLKLLEEPPEYARFFLILPSSHLLLPTVKSRLALIQDPRLANKQSRNGGDKSVDEVSKSAKAFLGATEPKRLEMVKSLMDSITKEKKTKQDVIDFLNALEETVHAGGVKKNNTALEAIETARKYMNDRSPSLKMLLEYVALNV